VFFSVNSEVVVGLKKSLQFEKLEQEIAKCGDIIRFNESLIKSKTDEIESIRKSLTYRSGLAITTPIRMAERAIKWLKHVLLRS
jgi:hypothetical protein